MAAVGIISLVLTVYALIYYAYLHRHCERDVSFFLSVEIIFLFMNLCTNAGKLYGLAWLYFITAIVFIALGWAVSVKDSIAFYKSIGPWVVNTVTDTAHIGLQLLSFILFPAGMVLYFVWYRTKSDEALFCGRMAMWGLFAWFVIVMAILGLVL